MSELAITACATTKSCATTSRPISRPAERKPPRQFFDARPGVATAAERTDSLVLSLLPLVRQVAAQMRRHLPPQVELGDLVHEGVLGLLDALGKFDARRHVKIESYARHRIRGAILDSLRRSDPASRDVRRKAHQVAKAAAACEARLGRQASSSDMAQELGVSLEEWHQLERQIQVADSSAETSLDQAEENRPALSASLPSTQAADPFEACYRREQQAMVRRALDALGERDRAIIRLYYHQSLTMKEIGERLGIDESRVSQLHSRALARLQKCVRVMAAHAPAPRPACLERLGPR